MKQLRLTRKSYGDAIKAVFSLFIKPFASALSQTEDEGLTDGIRRFFNVDTRSIYFATAKVNFTIPGKEWLHGHPTTLGYSGASRAVRRGKGVVLRFDDLEPNKIEMQVDERVYVMTKELWQSIEQHVEIVG